MNRSQTLDTCLVDTLEGTNPKLEVGIHRVLHKHRDVHSLQGIGYRLHGERIGRRTGTNPEDIDTILQGEFHMLSRCHLGGDEHLRFLLHLSEPYESGLTMPLKATWLRTGLPHACTEIVAAFHRQLTGSGHHLFLSLCRARACNHEGTFIVTR